MERNYSRIITLKLLLVSFWDIKILVSRFNRNEVAGSEYACQKRVVPMSLLFVHSSFQSNTTKLQSSMHYFWELPTHSRIDCFFKLLCTCVMKRWVVNVLTPKHAYIMYIVFNLPQHTIRTQYWLYLEMVNVCLLTQFICLM